MSAYELWDCGSHQTSAKGPEAAGAFSDRRATQLLANIHKIQIFKFVKWQHEKGPLCLAGAQLSLIYTSKS